MRRIWTATRPGSKAEPAGILIRFAGFPDFDECFVVAPALELIVEFVITLEAFRVSSDLSADDFNRGLPFSVIRKKQAAKRERGFLR